LNVVGSKQFKSKESGKDIPLLVAKVDTDKYPALAATFNIDALPTLILFKDGCVQSRMIGLVKSDFIISEVEKCFMID